MIILWCIILDREFHHCSKLQRPRWWRRYCEWSRNNRRCSPGKYVNNWLDRVPAILRVCLRSHRSIEFFGAMVCIPIIRQWSLDQRVAINLTSPPTLKREVHIWNFFYFLIFQFFKIIILQFTWRLVIMFRCSSW